MKQTPLKRSQGLRSDPEKVADWQQRSRTELTRTELTRGSMQVVPPAQRKRADRSPLEEALDVPFRARRPARTQTCIGRPGAPCGLRATAWHHWLAREHMRVYMRSLARALGMSPEMVKARLGTWLRDERNLSPMCHDCHQTGEQNDPYRGGFTAVELRPSVWEFAREIDDALEAAGRQREAVVRLTRDYR